MTTLVVFETMFGSTQAAAEAIAFGLREIDTVDVVDVADLASMPSHAVIGGAVDLLVVGAPTHANALSTRATRRMASREAGVRVGSTEFGVREWLDTFRVPVERLLVAAFDTRIESPGMPGSAARNVLRTLQRRGGTPVAPARSFLVSGMTGGLLDGQLVAAWEWGCALGAVLQRAQ